MFKIVINNPFREMYLGIFTHKATEYKKEEDSEEFIEVGEITRIIIGFAIFNIEIYL